MQEIEKEQAQSLAPADPKSEPLTPAVPQADALNDDPEDILLNAIAEIDTQPLPPQQQEVYWPLVILTLLCLFSFAGGTIIALLTYPTVTIDVVPVTKPATLTTQLDLPTRALAPVTLSKSETVPTSGKGHQDARAAIGTLTLYSGLFTPQYIPSGTVFTASNGEKVATDTAITVPAANPPQFAAVIVAAHALSVGKAGNIGAGEINTTVSNGVAVKNTSTFTGGRDTRDFQAVAQADIDGVTTTLRDALIQDMPQAFPLTTGESVSPANCVFSMSPNHQAGEEANTLTVKATESCKGIAYNSEQMTQRAIRLFIKRTTPGIQYQLLSDVQVQVVSVNPLTISCHGLWMFVLSEDEERFLAERIAGDSPQQARKYLLQTGFISQAKVTQALPKDFDYIHFRVIVYA